MIRWRSQQAPAWNAAGPKTTVCAPDEHDGVRRQQRVIAAEESRSSTRGSPGSGSATELHRRGRAGSAQRASGTQTTEANWCKAGLSLRSTETSQSEKAREKNQEAEALVASAADVLVSALEAEKAPREEARTECMEEESGYESKITAAELHEVLRNVIDSVVEGVAAQSPESTRASGSSVRSKSHADADGDTDKQQHAREAHAGPQDEQCSQAHEDREPEDGRGQQQGLRRRQRWLHDLGRRGDALKGQEHQGEQTVRACDDDGRGLRATFLWNTVTACVHASSKETRKRSVNELHKWFLPKQQHRDDRSQESICKHPEARSNTHTNLMQIDGPATAEETHSDKAQQHTEDTHTMPEDDDDNPHITQMQIDKQGDHEWDCIINKKTIAQ